MSIFKAVSYQTFYLFEVSNKSSRQKAWMFKINNKDIRKTSRRSGVFIVNLEHISNLFLVFLLFNLDREMFNDKGEIDLIWFNKRLSLI